MKVLGYGEKRLRLKKCPRLNQPSLIERISINVIVHCFFSRYPACAETFQPKCGISGRCTKALCIGFDLIVANGTLFMEPARYADSL